MFWKKMEGLFQNPVKPNRYLHSAGVRSLIVLGIGSADHTYPFSLFSASAWIKVEQLKPYHAHKEEMIKINKGKRFQQAVDAVEEFLRRAKGKDQVRGFTILTLC